MKFAKWTYLIAGIYGILAVAPMFFQEQKYGFDHPPAITHPEFYYGFVCVTLAWQFAFLVISRDPGRFRALMPVTWFEKFPFVVAIAILHSQGRVPDIMIPAAAIDLVLGILFVISYFKTRGHENVSRAS